MTQSMPSMLLEPIAQDKTINTGLENQSFDLAKAPKVPGPYKTGDNALVVGVPPITNRQTEYQNVKYEFGNEKGNLYDLGCTVAAVNIVINWSEKLRGLPGVFLSDVNSRSPEYKAARKRTDFQDLSGQGTALGNTMAKPITIGGSRYKELESQMSQSINEGKPVVLGFSAPSGKRHTVVVIAKKDSGNGNVNFQVFDPGTPTDKGAAYRPLNDVLSEWRATEIDMAFKVKPEPTR